MAMRLVTLTLKGLVAKDVPVILVKQGGVTQLIREEMEQEGTAFHDNSSVWWLLNKFREIIILLQNNFGTPVTEEEYYAM